MLRCGHGHIERRLADTVSPGLAGLHAADMPQAAADEAKAALRRLNHRGDLRNDLHGTQHIGVQRGVKQLARGRRQRRAGGIDASHIERGVYFFAVKLPGQAADAGRLAHVHGQHLGPQRLHACPPGGIAHSGNDTVARFGVLANKFQTQPARSTDDKYDSHDDYKPKMPVAHVRRALPAIISGAIMKAVRWVQAGCVMACCS